MPLLPSPPYRPAFPFRSGHLQTVYAARLRRAEGPAYRRERIDTPDGDFLDLDWTTVGASRVAVVSHGLEGNSGRTYVRGMARALNLAGWDVLAWNYRGCSGTPNRTLRLYHSGATDDLDTVLRHALSAGRYATAALVGFSLGGNLTLKYLGERGTGLDPRLRRAVAFSTPCDLAAASAEISKPHNWIYTRYFLTSLRDKVRQKAVQFPDHIDLTRLKHIRTLFDFDDAFTAPIHGFDGAADYYRRCSSKAFLDGIHIPTLLVNAADDSFLPAACYPVEEARNHAYLHLEIPDFGGHVGFVGRNGKETYWSEVRAAAFLGTV